MKVQNAITNFTAGELSPRLDLRIDTKKYASGAFTIENAIVMPHGGLRKRPGTKFIAEVKDSTDDPRLIAFEFSTEQSYMLEFGNGYIRPFKDQGTIIGSSKTITGISEANPGIVTAAAHGFSTGDQVYLSGISGMTQLNNQRVTITVLTANSFSIGIDTRPYDPWTSGGTASKPVNITTSYTAADVEALTHAQSADTLYLGHGDFAPAKLTRSSHTAWTLSNADIKNGPFRTINTDDTHYLSVAVSGSATVSGATLANPVVITTAAAHGFLEGATVTFSGVGGMVEINGNTYVARNVTSTTFELWSQAYAKVDGSGFTAYTSGGTVTASTSSFGTISPGTKVTLTSTDSLFTADHVGALFRLWEPGQTAGVRSPPFGDGTASIAENDQYTNDGKVYAIKNLSLGGSGADWLSININRVPSHEAGVVRVYGENTSKYFDAVYLHDSSSVLEITAYSSATSVTARVVRNHIPKSVVDFRTSYWEEGAWSDHRGYPSLIGFHEGRLYAATSASDPQTVWASKTQAFEDFQDGADDDRAISYTVASGRVDKFLWMMPGKTLALGTASSEYIAAASNQNEALTPSNVRMVPQTQYGSSEMVWPIRIGNVILFGQRRGAVTRPAKKVRELSYSFEADSFLAPDTTIVSEHITGTGITSITYQADPDSVAYCVRADGQIAGLTYEAEQDVKGWHRQIIGGTYAGGDAVVERLATVPGTLTDELWMIITRTINGQTKKYIEVLTPGLLDETDPEDAIYLDSALTYDSTETSTITGLWHLEGETVYALADGAKQGPFTVSGGTITLTTAASKVHVGLQYQTTIETTDIEAGARAGTAKSRPKNLSDIYLDLYRSLGGRAGMGGNQYSADRMLDIVYRTPADVMGSAPTLRTGLQRHGIAGGWDGQAILRIEHDEPYPFMLLGLVEEISTTG